MSLVQSIISCTNCPLHREMPCGPLPPYGNGKILIVMENPSKEDALYGEPMERYKRYFNNVLLPKADLTLNDVTLTFLTKCTYDSSVFSNNLATAVCKKWLVEEIKEFQPSHILTLGKTCTYTLLEDLHVIQFSLLLYHRFHYKEIPVYPLETINKIMMFGDKKLKSITKVLKEVKNG